MFGTNYHKIGVIGAGGWGTALASLLSENGYEVTIWAYEKDVADEININHTNPIFLKDSKLNKHLKATNELKKLRKKDLLLLAIPTQYIRSIVTSELINFKDKLIVNVAKGIEKDSLLRISELLADCASIHANQYTILTGPSHAEEVSKKTPTVVVAASENAVNSQLIQKLFTNEYFRVYTTSDVIGCEVGGALKNIIAIAAGIVDGLGFGDNTKAALITRGLAEISRLGTALGANPLTFSGLSGLGDLFVTCNSQHSRNRYVGEMIGKGKNIQEVIQSTQMIAEGVSTTQSAYNLGKKHSVELPITEQVYKILFENIHPNDALKDLMTRQTKREWWW